MENFATEHYLRRTSIPVTELMKGGAENASMEIVSTRGWKTQVRKRPVQTARVEIASMEKASTDRNCGNLKYGKRKYKSKGWKT